MGVDNVIIEYLVTDFLMRQGFAQCLGKWLVFLFLEFGSVLVKRFLLPSNTVPMFFAG